MTQPDPALREAFLTTSYGTAESRANLSDAPGPAPIWARGRWGIVTAWNPQGRAADETANRLAQAKLLAEVQAQGWPRLTGHNGSGEWREQTLIIQGIQARELSKLGRRCGQAAVLWGWNHRAALLWLDAAKVYAVDRRWVIQASPEL
ncbi:DUF3293 domain-containing protein [Deinococcus radiophilus]|uniref:DUF3293 domain-containing protein n=1 Tax=Deinococcus radiophilus TaxID=32062 RepID=A0A3S0I9H8_9DEIO|nr:DUF3293 domain-containing protein [Deinococcus radiophilus]RTR28357.1 DUF3293 domain-containing protein [Deinococcus radiophilus]UFA51224.1 DUF3293 domain-containing protein [Deinococcus radiophilus]